MFKNYTPQQLCDAIEIELQKSGDPKMAAIIAMKRLQENPEYYEDMKKAKYIRRTGYPGHYKYIYKEESKKEAKPEEKKEGKKIPQTETPEFKKWFGNSKVVDENGKPLVVYHGSDKELTIIQPGYDEPGAWFTENKMNAANYAKGLDAAIHSVYLKAENPLVVKFDDNMQPSIPGLSQDEIDELGLDNNISIVKYAEKKRFDSVHFPNGNFSESDNTWVVFSSSQIKSATGNRGTFDPNETDMTKAATHKYIKRVPKPSGKGYYYFYTHQQFKDYKEKGVIPGQKKEEKFNLIETIKTFFGFGDKRQAEEKIKEDYKAHEIEKKFSISLKTWADHLEEYFKNKDKWDRLFGKEKTPGVPGEKKPSGEKKEPTGGVKKSLFKMSVMKAIYEFYHERPKVHEPVKDNFDTMPESKYDATTLEADGWSPAPGATLLITPNKDIIDQAVATGEWFIADDGFFKDKTFQTREDAIIAWKEHNDNKKPVVQHTENGSKIEKNVVETPEQKEESKKDEEIAAREGYFNEKPAEVLNVGKDVWGAARHNFDTYEKLNVDISRLEEDGTAAAYVTKKNLFGDYGLANKDGGIIYPQNEFRKNINKMFDEFFDLIRGSEELKKAIIRKGDKIFIRRKK